MLPLHRRKFLATAGATTLAAASPLGFPAIAQGATVKVGAALPFSGGLELFGEQARLGLDLAAAEINASGGILGQDVEILYRDMKTDPKTAAERARELVQREEVLAVVGPITSSARNAMVPVMEGLKTPLLYATNYEGADDSGGGCGRYLFFLNTVPNQDTAPLIPWLAAQGYGDSYYMFGMNYVWPRNIFRAARAVIAATNGTVLGEEYVPAGEKDFTSVIRKIADEGPEILLFALPGADGVTFIKQAEEFGLLDQVTVAFLGFSETYLGAFGAGKGENMITGVPFVASDKDPGISDFVGRVQTMHGPDVKISHYVFTHYNALMALKLGLETSGEMTREAAVDGMEGLVFDVATGHASILADDHHTAMQMYIAKTEGGSLHVVDRLGVISPESSCGA
jgi:urea transport system substrate-binding protein